MPHLQLPDVKASIAQGRGLISAIEATVEIQPVGGVGVASPMSEPRTKAPSACWPVMC
jgi:hypothetical protein